MDFPYKTSPRIPQLFQRHEDSIWDIIITVFSKIENQYESRHRTIMAKLAQRISNNSQTLQEICKNIKSKFHSIGWRIIAQAHVSGRELWTHEVRPSPTTKSANLWLHVTVA